MNTTRLFSKLAGLLCVVALVLSCSKGGAGPSRGPTTLDSVLSSGTLRVGYVVYPPTVIQDPNTGALSGHFVDAIRYIAELLDVQVEFREADWSTFVAALQSGDVDLSIAATYRTIPRAAAVSFTKPIIYVGSSAIVRKGDNRFDSVDDFDREDVTVALIQGDGTAEWAQEHLTRPTFRILSSGNMALAPAEVLAGQADAALVDAWTSAQFAQEHDEVVDLFADDPFEVIGVGWAVRHGDPTWLNFINTSLDYLESTGRMKKWEDNYDAKWLRPVVDFRVH